jgi:catechol 2,3-dioxygenase-like lactoylglutathione lyase family enzyme
MLTAIDHLVTVVPELDAAISSYRELGFTVTPGGRHPIGTHNALIGLADGSYLELIAFFEPNPQHRWYRRLQEGGGLIDFCMQTDDVDGDVEAFRDAGVPISDRRPLSRVRPDGYTVRWTLSIPDDHAGVAPFLIADETPRAERVPRATTHPNGATGIGALTVAVHDAARVRHWYEAVPGAAIAPAERDDLEASGIRVAIGPHRLDFVAPAGPRSPLVEWLATRGPAPYAATLTSASKKGPLDPERTCGARLSFA